MANRNGADSDSGDASGATIVQTKACRVRLKRSDMSAKQPTSGKKTASQPDLAEKKSAPPSDHGHKYPEISHRMEDLGERMKDVLEVLNIPIPDVARLLRIMDGYKGVVLDLVAENEFLRGKVFAFEGSSARLGAVTAPANVVAVEPKVSKPVET